MDDDDKLLLEGLEAIQKKLKPEDLKYIPLFRSSLFNEFEKANILRLLDRGVPLKEISNMFEIENRYIIDEKRNAVERFQRQLNILNQQIEWTQRKIKYTDLAIQELKKLKDIQAKQRERQHLQNELQTLQDEKQNLEAFKDEALSDEYIKASALKAHEAKAEKYRKQDELQESSRTADLEEHRERRQREGDQRQIEEERRKREEERRRREEEKLLASSNTLQNYLGKLNIPVSTADSMTYDEFQRYEQLRNQFQKNEFSKRALPMETTIEFMKLKQKLTSLGPDNMKKIFIRPGYSLFDRLHDTRRPETLPDPKKGRYDQDAGTRRTRRRKRNKRKTRKCKKLSLYFSRRSKK
jgi:hypothetical protein